MPSSSRRAADVSRGSSRRPLGRGFSRSTEPGRPQAAPFATAFGLLVAAEDLYLAWLLWEPDAGLEWFVLGPVMLAAVAGIGAVLVLLGRARGWLVLTVAAVLPMVALLALALLFGALGGGQAMWWALLLLVGPVGCLVLALRRSVREWTSPARARRSTGGARRAAPSR